jgi:glucuronate isomerase
MNVRLICTTDDPVDDLAYHKKIKNDNWHINVLPAFRPDKAMNVDDVNTLIIISHSLKRHPIFPSALSMIILLR